MTLPLANLSASMMFAAGCAMLTFWLLRRSSRYFGRTRRSKSSEPLDLQPRPSSAWDGAQRDTLAVVERQKVEMHDMARELTGQLSTKVLLLERLIADSQRQINRMEALIEELEQASDKAEVQNTAASSVE